LVIVRVRVFVGVFVRVNVFERVKLIVGVMEAVNVTEGVHVDWNDKDVHAHATEWFQPALILVTPETPAGTIV
jgi:hypothetical protein